MAVVLSLDASSTVYKCICVIPELAKLRPGLQPVKPALTLCHSQTLLRGHVNTEELPRSMWATGTPLVWLHPSLAPSLCGWLS